MKSPQGRAALELLEMIIYLTKFNLYLSQTELYTRSTEIDEKGTLKATEHDKYENIAGSV
jgi:hypothetical protein